MTEATRGDRVPLFSCPAAGLAAAAVALGAVGLKTAQAQSRPNIIVIVADDLGTEAIEGEAWDNALGVHTPNLARWASDGRVFANTRVYPVCSPTRSALMTGREAFRTGIVGVLWPETAEPTRRALSLQPQETTIAEALKTQSYTTILVDKWHLGWDESAGVMPRDQGFDEFFDFRDTLPLDDPIAVGDEHLSLAVDQAIDAVQNRQHNHDPYALFFCTIDPHQREDASGREPLLWWKVDDRLLPSGEDYYAPQNENNRNRYRAVVEALDTELFRMLHELDVVDSRGRYRESSNTVVFFIGDNGTPRQVSVEGHRAKGSVYERGTHVPLFVFGEGVPSDGAVQDRVVSAVDLYETVADVADLSSNGRGSAPRDARSFADRIGYNRTGPTRTLSLSADGDADNPSACRVSLTDGIHKLVVRGGGAMLARLASDEFYDLQTDPLEDNNLIPNGLNTSERSQYLSWRDQIVDYWPNAMSEQTPLTVDIPVADIMFIDDHDNTGTSTLALGTYHPGRSDERESRVLVKFNIDRLDQLLPQGKTIDDIIGAQIGFGFARESAEPDETDTGVITAHPLNNSWSSSGRTRWRDINNEYDPNVTLGSLDVAPHIIPDPPGNKQFGVPLTLGTPVSFGHSQALVDQIHEWHDRPWSNDGVVLLADVLPNLDGDQRIFLMNKAALRVTLR